MSRIQIVSSLRSSDDLFFTVTFSSGEKLNFTAEEAFEYGRKKVKDIPLHN